MNQPLQPHTIAGRIAAAFLHNPLTLLLGITLLLLGYLALVITPREEDPQIAISGGTIMVMLPGASPEEIRNVIIQPLERKIKEIQGVEHIYGVAMQNMGMLNVMYTIGEDRETSNVKLYDKVMQNMDQLPRGALAPLVRPFDIDIDIPILSIAFYLKPDSPLDYVGLTQRVDAVRSRLGSVENLAKMEIKGGAKEQYNILVDAHKLSFYGLSLGQVATQLDALLSKNPDMEARTKEGELVVFGVQGVLEDKVQLQHLIVALHQGAPVYLQDIATITQSEAVQTFERAYVYLSDTLETSHRQVTLTLSKLRGSNAVVIAKEVLESLEGMEELFAKEGIGTLVTRNYGTRADEAVNGLVSNLAVSIVIISLLLVFTLGWRESLIVTFLVPAIFAVTLFVAYLGDQTINRITLFAFLLSLGILVDAAIIVIENIHRHLHIKTSTAISMDTIIIEATDEISAPTNIATIAIVLTMVPMAFVGQMMGQFMRPIPLNVPVTILASLVIAYIFAPYLARRILKRTLKGGSHEV
ncbi:MAG: efflux RND transporter permease subunit [Campylobacterales bacterium]|nr:efflux RND transporter permease subunit [Campylobacterales bacterium]